MNASLSDAVREIVTRYLAENRWKGTRGIAQVRRGTQAKAIARSDAQGLAGPRIGPRRSGQQDCRSP